MSFQNKAGEGTQPESRGECHDKISILATLWLLQGHGSWMSHYSHQHPTGLATKTWNCFKVQFSGPGAHLARFQLCLP